jgi:formylglycine-generating enzyme required for sulfatase activity
MGPPGPQGPASPLVLPAPFGIGFDMNTNGHEVVPIPGTKVAMSKYETTMYQFRFFNWFSKWNKSESWKKTLNVGESIPVASVSWNDAQDYCNYLSLLTGRKWRLPTEAEWNIAVGTTTYPWGNHWPPNAIEGNYWFLAGDGYSYTAPVGSYKANAFGLHDLGGNVWEWMQDTSGTNGFIRGGSWADPSDGLTDKDLKSTARYQLDINSRMESVGFRVVVEIP